MSLQKRISIVSRYHFPLTSLLEELLDLKVSTYILNSHAWPKRARGDKAEIVREVFSSGLVNFTHFISTETHLSVDTIHELLRSTYFTNASGWVAIKI